MVGRTVDGDMGDDKLRGDDKELRRSELLGGEIGVDKATAMETVGGNTIWVQKGAELRQIELQSVDDMEGTATATIGGRNLDNDDGKVRDNSEMRGAEMMNRKDGIGMATAMVIRKKVVEATENGGLPLNEEKQGKDEESMKVVFRDVDDSRWYGEGRG